MLTAAASPDRDRVAPGDPAPRHATLQEICRVLEVGEDVVEDCASLEEAVGRLIAECERHMPDPAAAPLRSLVQVASEVAVRRAASEDRQRLESLEEVLRTLGTLSHQINNPLTALLGRTQILQARQASDPGVLKAAAVIQESAQRIADLVRELAVIVRQARQAGGDATGR